MDKNKKILVLFCGGTIVMEEKGDGSLSVPDNKDSAIEMLRNVEPRLSTIADYDIEFIANIDSTNLTPEDWDRMLYKIKEKYQQYDGFVITHGTDTMAYTAAALNLAISGLGKPVILTGSQIPASKIETDARLNLVNAFRVATIDISGVFIVFDQRIILGSKATKSSESSLDAFQTVNGEDAGEISIDIKIKPWVKKRISEPHQIEIIPGFEPDIFVYTITPGCDPSDLEFLLHNEKIKGIIIRAYGTGNIPYGFENFFKKAKTRKLPVVVTSQCLHGKTLMPLYDVGRKALELGAIEGHEQSLENLAVKLMWALRHGPDQIEKIIIKREE
ncbi:MAG TPA: asparaginase [Candidatus Aminicenantes bacterium]|nr:MAG: L-asparaginase 1 [Candidatus Aminicenantes bacterium]HEK85307.1 asparaginase [Candidatus Aminicenantes bacterium]